VDDRTRTRYLPGPGARCDSRRTSDVTRSFALGLYPGGLSLRRAQVGEGEVALSRL
jgi:hypothetical protein